MSKPVVLCVLLTLLSLAGCKESEQTVTTAVKGSHQLVMSFPAQSQSRVPEQSPLFLVFSSPVTSESPEQAFVLEHLASGETVPLSARTVNQDQTLILEADEKLRPASEYRLSR
ncbi:MAG: Ig-like domain-containing protein, partial [Oleiphilaceae bacterium]|nr:Ig-like domain-containing protein [Oleiphilaceae bacterium]